MEHTKVHSNNTQLKDRTLWFDGTSSFNPKDLDQLIRKYNVKYVTSTTTEIDQYNKSVPKTDQLIVKQTCEPLDLSWNIPTYYKQLDVMRYLVDKHFTKFHDVQTFDARERRLVEELIKFKDRGFFDILRTIIFIINKLTEKNIVWGIGRGSSVSSYVLYVIGVHDVDSFEYDLSIDDFLHD